MAGYVEAAEAYFRSPVAARSRSAELAAWYRGLEAEGGPAGLGRGDRPPGGRGCRTRPSPRALPRATPTCSPAWARSTRTRASAAVAEVAEHRRARAARGQVPPVAAGVRAGRPAVLADLRGLRAARAAGPVPHRDQRHRRPPARRPGHQDRPGAPASSSTPVAAARPELTVVAAHFGWPWHMELIAMALHKTNVYIDISGWAPRRIPAEVIRELRGRLSGQFLWGSDFPFIAPGAVPGRTRLRSTCPARCWSGCCTRTRPGSSAWTGTSPD